MSRFEESSVPPEDNRDTGHEADALPTHGDESAPDEVAVEPLESDPRGDAPLSPEAEAMARAAELADKLKRVEAGFVNDTKRIRRQAEQDRKYAIEKVVVDLLPVVDALGSARDSIGDGAGADAIRDGLDLVDKQLAGVLKRYGVSEIHALGQPFDPSLHQAMMMVENPDYAPNTICEVLRSGYELNGRVVRAAEVLVVKAGADDGAPDGGR